MNYVYDGQNIIMAYDQSGNITAIYTHGPNMDEPLAGQKNSSTYYYHADGLGSITALTDASGSIVQTYSYDSFGNITATGSIRQPYTYTAREYDHETGMYFYRARYYDPKVGRFVTKDPISFNGGDYNLYAYVGNDPVNLVDPEGLAPQSRTRQCDSCELAICTQMCASKGVESCMVSQTFRVTRHKDGLTRWEWKDGPMSCSCKDREPKCPNDNPPLKVPPPPKWLPFLILIPIIIFSPAGI